MNTRSSVSPSASAIPTSQAVGDKKNLYPTSRMSSGRLIQVRHPEDWRVVGILIMRSRWRARISPGIRRRGSICSGRTPSSTGDGILSSRNSSRALSCSDTVWRTGQGRVGMDETACAAPEPLDALREGNRSFVRSIGENERDQAVCAAGWGGGAFEGVWPSCRPERWSRSGLSAMPRDPKRERE